MQVPRQKNGRYVSVQMAHPHGALQLLLAMYVVSLCSNLSLRVIHQCSALSAAGIAPIGYETSGDSLERFDVAHTMSAVLAQNLACLLHACGYTLPSKDICRWAPAAHHMLAFYTICWFVIMDLVSTKMSHE